MNIKCAMIGCGGIGYKRTQALPKQCELVACVDINLQRAQALAATYKARAYDDWRIVINDPAIDMVMIATPHVSLAEIAYAAVEQGKHVLLEKPAAISSEALRPLMKLAKQTKRCVHIGFNHRYHRALQKAKELVEAGALGPLMFVRARYGHGGRLGYDKEWRADPAISGGGELIDQGVHLIDLARWFLGDFTEVSGFSKTYYWDMPVEDNGFMLLKTATQQVAFLHASCTEWKNLFSFEIYGQHGKLDINGLGGSYGVERLTYYKMLPEMGPPETSAWEFPMRDHSWEMELKDFVNAIEHKRASSASLEDACAALEIVEKIYSQSSSSNMETS